jgi:uncharacterized membrane protein required for colicin V production
MATDYNIIDIVFITSALIIIAIASFRGLIKEVFSLINWATAFVASYLLSGIVAKIFAEYSTINISIIETIARFAIFIIVFLIMIFSTAGLAKEITSAFSPALNNFLGSVFGIFKTLLIFGLLYATYLTINHIMAGSKIIANKIDETPKIISAAKTGNIIKYSGKFLQPIVYGFISSIYNNYGNDLIKQGNDITPILNLMKNNYDIDEFQKQLQDGNNVFLEDVKKIDNSNENNQDIDSYQSKFQKLQQILNNINASDENAKTVDETEKAIESTKQQQNVKPENEEKGYNQQEIKNKDYIIKIINK